MCKLVMIDDNRIEHLIMKKMFQRYELFRDAKYFEDGRTMLKLLNNSLTPIQQIPDIIFLDLNMPGFSGWEFLEHFDKIKKNIKKNIQIFILSSSVDNEDKKKARAYPFVSDFLSKPLERNRLDTLYLNYTNLI